MMNIGSGRMALMNKEIYCILPTGTGNYDTTKGTDIEERMNKRIGVIGELGLIEKPWYQFW